MAELVTISRDDQVILAGLTLTHEKVGHTMQGLWHHKNMQLPAYIQHIANDLIHERGMLPGRAIATAVSRCKVWCAGGDKVNPDTRAKACAAIAEWEKLKVQAHLTKGSVQAAPWDPSKHPRKPKGPGGGQFAPGSKQAAPTNQNPVGMGAGGQRVTDLQSRLNQLGYKLAVDGNFGPKTLAAVRAFQLKRGLKVDGLVGPKTTAALRLNEKSRRKPGSAPVLVKKTRKKPKTVKGGSSGTTAAAPLKLATLPGVELLAAGTWKLSSGRQTFTRSDIEAAIESAKCPAVGPPLIKIGHTETRFQAGDGEPALGKVMNMRPDKSGMKLVGDLAGMPAWLGDISASAFPRRSIEGAYNFQCQSGHKHPFIVSALALLGLTRPGVGVLNDLQDIAKLYGVHAATGEAERAWQVTYEEGEAIVPVTEEDVRRAYYASAGVPDSWWITELQMAPSQLVVADGDGNIYQVPFQIENEDTISFGDANPLESYAELAASRGSGPLTAFASAEESRAVEDDDEDYYEDDEGDDVQAADNKPYGDVAYADPKNGKYPIDTAEHARAAWAYINKAHNAGMYPMNGVSLDEVKGRIMAACKKFGIQVSAADDNEEGASEVEFSEELTASIRASLGLDDDQELTPELIAEGLRKQRVAASRPAGLTVTIDKGDWDTINAKVKAAEAYQKRQEVKERDQVIAAAVRDGRFSAARKPHYVRAWDADPQGARELIASLPKNVVPVMDIGSGGGAEDDLIDEEYRSLFPPGSVG